jgi:hypothetical protein
VKSIRGLLKSLRTALGLNHTVTVRFVDGAQAIAEQPPEAQWFHSSGEPMSPAPLDARMLRSRAKALIVSSGCIADRSGLTRDRLRAILAEREIATTDELNWISRALDYIQRDREKLLQLAERSGLRCGSIF